MPLNVVEAKEPSNQICPSGRLCSCPCLHLVVLNSLLLAWIQEKDSLLVVLSIAMSL